MPPPDERAGFFRCAFLRNAPRRYAVMLTLDEARRRDQKYDERRGWITDAMITHHLAGDITLAAPAAVDSHVSLLPLDIDAGGLEAIQALLAETRRRDLWAFGQYCPRLGLADENQRGYIWLPFDQATTTEQLQYLGATLIAAVSQPGWKIEPRAIHAVTRLPLARHTHTGRFGDLVISNQLISIDQDCAGALDQLRRAYYENPSTGLPEPAPPHKPAPRPAVTPPSSTGITITRYNQAHDIEVVIQDYGARPAKRRGLYFCPFHQDDHASLQVYTTNGHRYVHCLSTLSDCLLATHGRNDAFNVYCIGEGLDPKAALRRLNNREQPITRRPSVGAF